MLSKIAAALGVPVARGDYSGVPPNRADQGAPANYAPFGAMDGSNLLGDDGAPALFTAGEEFGSRPRDPGDGRGGAAGGGRRRYILAARLALHCTAKRWHWIEFRPLFCCGRGSGCALPAASTARARSSYSPGASSDSFAL